MTKIDDVPIIPADYWEEGDHALVWDRAGVCHSLRQRYGAWYLGLPRDLPIPDGWDWRVPVIRHQPAPAIDLELFRPAVYALSSTATTKEEEAEVDRLLALIDGQKAAPPGYVLVPVDERQWTDKMRDAGRAAVMAAQCATKTWTPRQHFEAAGRNTNGIPKDVLDERGPLTKESIAVMVMGAMLAAAPEVK